MLMGSARSQNLHRAWRIHELRQPEPGSAQPLVRMSLTLHVLVQLGQVNAYSDSPIGLGHYDHPCTPVGGGVDTRDDP